MRRWANRPGASCAEGSASYLDGVRGAGRAAWAARTARYREHVAPLAVQAIAPVLDAAGDLEAAELLDVGCGGGDLVARACARGARVHGIDFVPTTIELARRRHPGCRFSVGDAHALDRDDASCHVVTCAFALDHLADPHRALAEMRRVLRPGGALVCATRRTPGPHDALSALLRDALDPRAGEALGAVDGATTSPRFATRADVHRALLAAGLGAPLFRDGEAVWVGHRGAEVLGLVHGAFVRGSALLEALPASTRASVEARIAARAEALVCRGSIALPWPWRIVRARRVAAEGGRSRDPPLERRPSGLEPASGTCLS